MSWSEMSPYVKETAQRELTPKQLAILQDTMNGHSILTISRARRCSQATVRNHLERALMKLEPFLADRKEPV